MKNDYQDGMSNPEKMSAFMTKNLNIWLIGDGSSSYMDFREWQKCVVDDKIDFSGREVYVGVDMSKSTDLCGVSIVSKDEYDNLLIKSKAFLPQDTIIQKETSDKLPYSSYITAKKDWLCATEGKYVDQTEVESYIRNIEKLYNCKITAVVFDSWGALHLMSSLSEDYEVIDCKMTYKNFSPAIKRFREKIYDNEAIIENNPILNFCVGNAVTKSDLQENILLDKKKSSNRIDLLVSTIIAYSEVMNEEVEDDFGDYFMV